MTGIVIGYHGTRLNYVEKILRDGFNLSKNEYDWLGDGVYFFQDGYLLAKEWSYKLHKENGVVMGAKINLESCMDLVDSGWSKFLSAIHDELVNKIKDDNSVPPYQSKGAHRLDRAVINYAVASLEKSGHKISSVRAPFHEGDPLYPNSALFSKSHVQIVVRDVSIISDICLESTDQRGLPHD